MVKVYDKISHGLTDDFNDYEREITAELIRKGYVVNYNGKMLAAMPVYTAEQFKHIVELQKNVVIEIGELFEKIHRTCAAILNNHVPAHLRKQVDGIAGMSVFHDGTLFRRCCSTRTDTFPTTGRRVRLLLRML